MNEFTEGAEKNPELLILLQKPDKGTSGHAGQWQLVTFLLADKQLPSAFQATAVQLGEGVLTANETLPHANGSLLFVTPRLQQC